MDGLTYGQSDGWMDRDRQTDQHRDELTDRRTDGWTDRQGMTYGQTCNHHPEPQQKTRFYVTDVVIFNCYYPCTPKIFAYNRFLTSNIYFQMEISRSKYASSWYDFPILKRASTWPEFEAKDSLNLTNAVWGLPLENKNIRIGII